MACKGICKQPNFPVIIKKIGFLISIENYRYCRMCEIYYNHQSPKCLCCGYSVRCSPRSKGKGRNKIKPRI